MGVRLPPTPPPRGRVSAACVCCREEEEEKEEEKEEGEKDAFVPWERGRHGVLAAVGSSADPDGRWVKPNTSPRGLLPAPLAGGAVPKEKQKLCTVSSCRISQ